VARWLCLALCLATWRGPVPWVHAHAADCGLDSHAAGEGLARHLADYHHGQHELGGWHFHWFDLCDCAAHDKGEPLTKKPRDPWVAIAAPLSASHDQRCGEVEFRTALARLLSLNDAFPAALFLTPGEVRLLSPTAPRSFASSLLAAAPLRAVIGVALC
jgi:hypothetical protein